MSNPKIHTKVVWGLSVKAFEDSSTDGGEWVVTVNERTERFDAREWTMEDSIDYLVKFELMVAKLN